VRDERLSFLPLRRFDPEYSTSGVGFAVSCAGLFEVSEFIGYACAAIASSVLPETDAKFYHD
jgi:hypothetical protein